jgi:hypothetical protein
MRPAVMTASMSDQQIVAFRLSAIQSASNTAHLHYQTERDTKRVGEELISLKVLEKYGQPYP